jgi:hypothetical protein
MSWFLNSARKISSAPVPARDGKVLQGSYNMETGAYRRVEGPTNVPYEITCSS